MSFFIGLFLGFYIGVVLIALMIKDDENEYNCALI